MPVAFDYSRAREDARRIRLRAAAELADTNRKIEAAEVLAEEAKRAAVAPVVQARPAQPQHPQNRPHRR